MNSGATSKQYVAREPVDIVALDSLDVRSLPGVILKYFAARDIIARRDVLEVHTRAISRTASAVIDMPLERMAFPTKAIQVDGGSESEDIFEREYQRSGTKAFVLAPHSPRLNGHVERTQRCIPKSFTR